MKYLILMLLMIPSLAYAQHERRCIEFRKIGSTDRFNPGLHIATENTKGICYGKSIRYDLDNYVHVSDTAFMVIKDFVTAHKQKDIGLQNPDLTQYIVIIRNTNGEDTYALFNEKEAFLYFSEFADFLKGYKNNERDKRDMGKIAQYLKML